MEEGFNSEVNEQIDRQVDKQENNREVDVKQVGSKCEEEKPEVVCQGCGFSGDASDFDLSISAYHDFKCPKCNTTNIDTSGLNKKWAKSGQKYVYGDDNFLVHT